MTKYAQWDTDSNLIAETYDSVDEITAAQIQAVAQELFDKDRLTTLIFK